MCKRLFLFIIALTSAFSLSAQVDGLFFQQNQVRSTINPAATGMWGDVNVSAGMRQQWMNFDKAPMTANLIAHGFIPNMRSGVGLNVRVEQFGPQKFQSAKLNYAYFVPFNQEAFLAIGLGGGAYNTIYDESNFFVKEVGDDRITYEKQQKLVGDFDFGMEFHMRFWQMGASITHLSYTFEDNSLTRPMRNAYVYVRRKVAMNRNWDFIPGVLWHSIRRHHTVEVSAAVRYNNNLNVSVHYRNPQTVGLTVGIDLVQGFRVSYSYEYGFDSMSPYNDGSNELWISYNLPMTNTYIQKKLRFFRWKKW